MTIDITTALSGQRRFAAMSVRRESGSSVWQAVQFVAVSVCNYLKVPETFVIPPADTAFVVR